MNHESPHDILLLLGRIEGKLDAVIKRMDKLDNAISDHEYRIGSTEGRLEAVIKRVDKLEMMISSLDQRVSTLEKAHARLKGGTAIVVTAFSAVTAVAAVLLRYAHRE